MYVQTALGNTGRLIAENRYEKAKSEIINAKIAHNASNDVFHKLVPFWQLKLYMHDVLGKTDFYKDVYEKIRINPNPQTQGECQLEFLKIVCDVATLDLTEFFEAWGFLTPINIEIDDYGKQRFTITNEQINQVKAEIAIKKYPKPKHSNIYDIRDDNVSSFR